MQAVRWKPRRAESLPPSRTNRRAVSPLIATILLVAIVIVLAAVLYVVVGNLTRGASATPPLGSSLYVGPAAALQGTSTSNSYCQKLHYCYSVPVAAAGPGLSIGGLSLAVRTAQGTLHEVTKNHAQVAIVGLNGKVLAYTQISKNQPFLETAWTHFASGVSNQTVLDDTMTIFLQFGNTQTNPAGSGFTLEVDATSGYTGSVVAALP